MVRPPIQELAPTGGYSSINFKRVPLKAVLSPKALFGAYIAVTLGANYMFFLTDKQILREEIEMRSCRNVMLPIVLAERDRLYLKQLRRNRDEEAKLMANVPGWEVGTWYGEPIYKTLPKDAWVDVHYDEFYVHADPKHAKKRAEERLWH